MAGERFIERLGDLRLEGAPRAGDKASRLARALAAGFAVPDGFVVTTDAFRAFLAPSLGAAIGLMMWLWLSVIVMLVGAELNAEIEHQTACDTTTGEEKPLGARGAVMADTVGRRWI